MSKYDPQSVWSLVTGYNTRRGEILDNIRVSHTPTVSWNSGEKHGVEDGSVHYQIQRFLETQPNKQATVSAISIAVPMAALHPDHYLRELEKQHICVRMTEVAV